MPAPDGFGWGATLPGACGVVTPPLAVTDSPTAPLTLATVPSDGAVSTVSERFWPALFTAASSPATTACSPAMVVARLVVCWVSASRAAVTWACAAATSLGPPTWSADAFSWSERSLPWSCWTFWTSWATRVWSCTTRGVSTLSDAWSA